MPTDPLMAVANGTYMTIDGDLIASSTGFRDDLTKALLDVTDLQDAAVRRMPGLTDESFSLDYNYVDGDAGYAAARAACENGTVVQVVEVIGAFTQTINCLIESVGTTVRVGQVVTGTVSLKQAYRSA